MTDTSGTGSNPTTLSKQGWAEDYLSYIGTPAAGPNDPRVSFLEQWIGGEGTFQEGNIYDPLDVEAPGGTQGSPGGGWTNTTLAEGEQTTYDTMASNDPVILGQLENPGTTESQLSTALGESEWAGLNDTAAGQQANELYGTQYIPSVSPDAGISTTAEVPFGGAYTGASGGVSGPGTPGSNQATADKAPGWLKDLDSYLNHGVPYGTTPTGGLTGGLQDTIIEFALKIGIGAVGFLGLLGGMIVVFGPAFLRKGGQATGFGQLEVSKESSARQAALRSDIRERENQRLSARFYRDQKKQTDELARIQARKEANLEIIEAKKKRPPKPTIPGPAEAAKPRARQMTPPGPAPKAKPEAKKKGPTVGAPRRSRPPRAERPFVREVPLRMESQGEHDEPPTKIR